MLARPRTESAKLSQVGPGSGSIGREHVSERPEKLPTHARTRLALVPPPELDRGELDRGELDRAADAELVEAAELERWIDECREIERAVRLWLRSQA